MARRKKNSIPPQTIIGVFVVLGGLWLFVKMAESAPNGSGSALGVVVLVIVAGAVGVPILRLVRRANDRKALLEKAAVVANRQLEPLLRRRAQLVRLDPYGKPVHEKWTKEIEYFVSQHLLPVLSQGERAALVRNPAEVSEIIAAKVEAAQGQQPAFRTFSDDMTPAEFETFCAEQLRLAGWNARVTMQSRDQGVDVVAEKAGKRVVLQCKLYARPVGNKSVQEATAARAHERADVGIVVSNNRYTEAAEELARSTNVLLLHHRDLQNLDDILKRHRG